MTHSFRIAFRWQVSIETNDDGQSFLITQEGTSRPFPLGLLGAAYRAGLHSLQGDGIPATDVPLIHQRIKAEQGLLAVGQFIRLLQNLMAQGALQYTLFVDNEPYLSLVPLAQSFRLHDATIERTATMVLSRFASIHRETHALVLDSPLGHGRLILHHPYASALVVRLAAPADYEALLHATNLERAALDTVLQVLLSVKAVTCVTDETTDEDRDPALRTWEYHDLLMHSRSRFGRQPTPLGGTFRFVGQIDPLPAVAPRRSQQVVALHKPDMNQLSAQDVPLTAALEGRRSRRIHGREPLTLHVLGSFLYRTARIQDTHVWDVGADGQTVPFELLRRAYPAGGGIHELDLYLTITRCTGIDAGLYRYDPQEHVLEHVAAYTAQVQRLVLLAKQATASTDEDFPQVLVTYAARFGRITWKYEGLAYALVLKHVGVVMQTMYLVAEAMGLAGCAVGTGDSDLFAQIVGIPYHSMTSVGEFTLGSRADDTMSACSP